MIELSDEQKAIMDGKICPYCKQPSIYTTSKTIFEKDYGMIYHCQPCDAYVGTHRGTNKAKGRLAKKELREWKKKAHHYFDQLWKTKVMTRQQAYKWLAEELKLPPEYTHIGMFSIKTCKRVVGATIIKLNHINQQPGPV